MGKKKQGANVIAVTTAVQSKRILTNEDWYPTREDGTIRVTMYTYSNEYMVDFETAAKYRIVVAGEDDTFMVRDFSSKEKDMAYYTFDRIVDTVTKEELINNLGFMYD